MPGTMLLGLPMLLEREAGQEEQVQAEESEPEPQRELRARWECIRGRDLAEAIGGCTTLRACRAG